MSTSGYFATPISVYNKKFEGLKETIVSYADTQKEDVENYIKATAKRGNPARLLYLVQRLFWR